MPREVEFVEATTRHGYPTVVGKIQKNSRKKITRTPTAKSTLLSSSASGKAHGTRSLRPVTGALGGSKQGKLKKSMQRSGGKVSYMLQPFSQTS